MTIARVKSNGVERDRGGGPRVPHAGASDGVTPAARTSAFKSNESAGEGVSGVPLNDDGQDTWARLWRSMMSSCALSLPPLLS